MSGFMLVKTNEISVDELRQVLEDVRRDVAVIAFAEDRCDFRNRALPVAQLQDGCPRIIQQNNAFRIQQEPLLSNLVVLDPGKTPERGNRRSGDRQGAGSR
jgi:hypothetical protein